MNKESLIHTSRWFAETDAKLPYDRISVVPQGKHRLPKDIESIVKESWNKVIEDRKLNLLKQFNEEDIIEEDVDGLTRLYVMENCVKRPRLFAGPMTRLNNYRIIKESSGDRLILELGETNYAELMATNNRNPFDILQTFGKKGLANPINVCIAMTIMNGDKEELFTFDRGFGLGEYPSRGDSREERLEICVAGGIDTQYTHPHDAVYKELFEEIGVLPNLGDQEFNYKQKGIVPLHANMLFGTLNDSTRIVLVTDHIGEYKSKFQFNETPVNNMVCTGIATNADPYDIDTSGNPIPHYRPELLYSVSTDLQREDIEGSWVRGQEHLDINFIPFSKDDLGAYLLNRYLNILPTGHAALMSAGKQKFGINWFNDVLKQTNERYPIESTHPFYAKVVSGEIEQPITQKLFSLSVVPKSTGKVYSLNRK